MIDADHPTSPKTLCMENESLSAAVMDLESLCASTSGDGFVPITVLTLEHSEDRQEFMRRQFESLGLPFRFLYGTDGRRMADEDLARVAPGGGTAYSGLLNPGEIGCALSHLSAIEQIANGTSRFGAVIEDDAVLLPSSTPFFTEQLLSELPPFDVLQLGGSDKRRRRLVLDLANVGGHRICAWPRGRFNMSAIVYSRDGAESLLRSIKDVVAPIDNMIFETRRPFGLRVVGVQPIVVAQSAHLASHIGERRGPVGVISKAGRELRRFRIWLWLWSSFIRRYGLAGLVKLRPG